MRQLFEFFWIQAIFSFGTIFILFSFLLYFIFLSFSRLALDKYDFVLSAFLLFNFNNIFFFPSFSTIVQLIYLPVYLVYAYEKLSFVLMLT